MNINDLTNNINSTSTSGLSSANTQDSSFFSSLLSGNTASMVNEKAKATSDKALKMSLQTSRETILQSVVNQKNQMLLESRGSSAKKTTEIAKEISF